MASTRMTTARKQAIVLAYLIATGGRIPTQLGELMRAMRELIPDLTETDLRKAIKWALRQVPLRPRQARRPPRLRLVSSNDR